MTRRNSITMVLGWLPLAWALLAGPLHSELLPALDQRERLAWQAVGWVNATGIHGHASCSGTLIAPDLVVTAAHCAGGTNKFKGRRHFVAGWDKGGFIATSRSAEIFVHPEYERTKGNHKFKYDVAVIQLESPVPGSAVTPLRIADNAALRLGELAVLGYHRKSPNVLNGRFDCMTLSSGNEPVVILDCEVINGNSGGPVLARVTNEWVLVAVVAGRVGGETPLALAVPVDEWLLRHWRAALVRAEQRRPG
ncbi:trypsin-like serine protease [Roseobacter sp. YSTF-M11]|uniref:Trypsin-like serine protease n=1 Tax=Roseobacter insulae TaxID=2859783 RepID=A0A9X1JYS2_9RHOB|nr:trypsin-like serine protease [Roseobacter insulae]MBW4708480.1 trypsin-like serine protease [Roseobacter insulae]